MTRLPSALAALAADRRGISTMDVLATVAMLCGATTLVSAFRVPLQHVCTVVLGYFF